MCLRWHSSWTITYSATQSGAIKSLQFRLTVPRRLQLPHREDWFRTETLTGTSPVRPATSATVRGSSRLASTTVRRTNSPWQTPSSSSGCRSPLTHTVSPSPEAPRLSSSVPQALSSHASDDPTIRLRLVRSRSGSTSSIPPESTRNLIRRAFLLRLTSTRISRPRTSRVVGPSGISPTQTWRAKGHGRSDAPSPERPCRPSSPPASPPAAPTYKCGRCASPGSAGGRWGS